MDAAACLSMTSLLIWTTILVSKEVTVFTYSWHTCKSYPTTTETSMPIRVSVLYRVGTTSIQHVCRVHEVTHVTYSVHDLFINH